MEYHGSNLRFRHACLACLELALRALVDPPVRAGMAHVAVPEDEGGVGLDDLERMFALSWLGHCEVFSSGVSCCLNESEDMQHILFVTWQEKTKGPAIRLVECTVVARENLLQSL